jgi:hypothetical protein
MPAVILEVIDLVIAAFSRVMSTRIGAWIVQMMLFFGIQMASQALLLAPLKAGLSAAFSGMASDVLAWVSYLNIDRALTIILSAYATVSISKISFVKKAD